MSRLVSQPFVAEPQVCADRCCRSAEGGWGGHVGVQDVPGRRSAEAPFGRWSCSPGGHNRTGTLLTLSCRSSACLANVDEVHVLCVSCAKLACERFFVGGDDDLPQPVFAAGRVGQDVGDPSADVRVQVL
jgi:hypothetical protein